MNNRSMTILFVSLLGIIAALFALACVLGRKQHTASIQSIRAEFSEMLTDEGRNIRSRTRTVERDTFALFDQTNPPAVWQPTNMLFRRDGNRFVPLGLPPPTEPGTLSPDYRAAWETAEAITLLATNPATHFRMPYNNFILSVNAGNRACLLPLDAFRAENDSETTPVISTTDPGTNAALSRLLHYPPLHVWIPTEQFNLRQQSAQQAYLVTKIMLGALLVVMICLGFAITLLVRRQHDMARQKSAFVSSVSHELRTPMALIRLYAESLASDNPPAGSRERYTRAIMAETDRLIALVNNVLDFARLEKGALVMDIRDTDVSKLCTDILESFQFRMEKEGLTFVRQITPGLTALVDPLAMTQVVFNIVDNAIKYSAGRSPITIELEPAGNEICLRVTDNGIGIPEALKPRIMLPFVRGEDSRVTAQRGSGIGLSVVTQLLERMHGSIRFYNHAPQGTVFEVRIPSTRA